MKAPDVIYANDYGLWYKEKQPVKETEAYIRKDALLEWAKERKKYTYGFLWEDFIDKLNSL